LVGRGASGAGGKETAQRRVQEAQEGRRKVKKKKPLQEVIEGGLGHNGLTRKQAEGMLFSMYNELNIEKFNCDFPEKPIIRITLETGGMKATYKEMGARVSICVSPFCDPKDYYQTMCHEMCHRYADGHGQAFQDKLREVAADQLWLEEELNRCKEWMVSIVAAGGAGKDKPKQRRTKHGQIRKS
jgi:hypothetical protein